MLTNDANSGRGREKQTGYAVYLKEIHYGDVPGTRERPPGPPRPGTHLTGTGDDMFFLQPVKEMCELSQICKKETDKIVSFSLSLYFYFYF
ncbi:hypothetical protein EO98_07200 [Methanosarcina sp. 2.H.T.1A.6]|nr:hypothetical protein EO97_17780 [Methanosarcina sp. 2.H.T.1A.15]KKG16418.1 hypothetical protein EO94_07055 [Methanosarcina sp. 2.H.T.1A.3]KKG21513.1 hypothetical protein EO98_07200 [Methanosarcina sp. 2.H.T.1A.6]KKG27415.1 hypothetical protein EO96_04195 [Methanosarcina sp. 2.H.T.1A.8]